jgi:signal peptidase II
MKRKYIALIIVGLLVVDQIVKIVVKTQMSIGESIPVFGSWFQIFFVENEGAAFGLKLGGAYGKLILSLFRIVVVCGFGWLINHLWVKKAPTGVIVGLALVLAGALGNIIDSAFYGMIFDGGGWSSFLHGRVVDMLYFPLFTIHDTPSWLGWLSGPDGDFTFFAPVFNLADTYISVAVIYLAAFQWRYLSK